MTKRKPYWVPKPREKLDYLLDLIASLDKGEFESVIMALAQASATPPHDKWPTAWRLISEDIEKRRNEA